MAAILPKILRRIANDIGGSNPKVLDLGLELDFSPADVDGYIATNKGGAAVTADGTTTMLFDWSRKTPSKDQVRILTEALKNAELGTIAEKLLPTAEGSQPPSGQSAGTRSGNKVTPEQINKLLDDFPRNKYHTFCYKLIGYSHNRADDLLTQKLNDSRAALAVVLADWETKTGGDRDKLAGALRASEAGGLVDNIYS